MWGYVHAVIDLYLALHLLCFFHCLLLSINCRLSSLLAEIVLFKLFDWTKTSVQDEFLILTLRRQGVWFYLGHNLKCALLTYCLLLKFSCSTEVDSRQSQASLRNLHVEKNYLFFIVFVEIFSWRIEKSD